MSVFIYTYPDYFFRKGVSQDHDKAATYIHTYVNPHVFPHIPASFFHIKRVLGKGQQKCVIKNPAWPLGVKKDRSSSYHAAWRSIPQHNKWFPRQGPTPEVVYPWRIKLDPSLPCTWTYQMIRPDAAEFPVEAIQDGSLHSYIQNSSSFNSYVHTSN